MAFNTVELLVAYLLNVTIAIVYYEQLASGKAREARGFSGHVFWTAAWFVVLLNYWVWQNWGSLAASMVGDANSVLLFGIWFSYAGRISRYKFYAPVALSFLLVYVLTLHWFWKTDTENVIFRQTVIYGPSLLLAMGSIASLAWVLYKYFQGPGRFAGIVLAIAYCVLQVPLFLFLLVHPSEPVPHWWWPTVVSWRGGLMLAYWPLILRHAGIDIAFRQVQQALEVLKWLFPSLGTLYAILRSLGKLP